MPLMKKQRIVATILLIFSVLVFEIDLEGKLVIVCGIFLGLGTTLFFVPFFRKNSNS